MTDWDDLADWWVEESADPAYRDDVQPVVDRLVAGLHGPTLDLGCGAGRLAESLPPPVIGCDLAGNLLSKARARGVAVVQCRLPDLDWMRPNSVMTAVACLVLEHVPDAAGFFSATAGAVAEGGTLVVVANHPAYTSAGAGPVVDESDGEVLWRWGSYLAESAVAEPAGEGTVVFHHRSLATILTLAARAGWSLAEMVESAAGPETVARVPSLAGQEHMPRLVGLRWVNRSGH